MSPVFSIVVPVYNAEKYLHISLNSILKQTYPSFELILVNDCSTDASLSICKSYASKDSRIIVIDNADNSGAAQSRNNGIEVATGKYLCFVDADDFIEPDYLEMFSEVLAVHEYGYLKCGVLEDYYEDSRLVYTKVCGLEDADFFGKQAILEQVIDMELKPLFGYLYNSVYKTSIIKNNELLLDRTLKVNEDFDFNSRYIALINDMKCLNYSGYHYAKRNNNSLSSQKNNYSFEVHLLKIRIFLKMLKEYDAYTKRNFDKVFWMFTRFVFSSVENGYSFVKIRENEFYAEYKDYKFERLNIKQRILVSVLQSDNSLLIDSFAFLLGFVKKHFPIVFAKIKR